MKSGLQKMFFYKGNYYFYPKGKAEDSRFKTVELNLNGGLKDIFKAPKIVEIQVTNRCNLGCEHCCVSSGIKYDNEMSDDQINDLLYKLKSYGVIEIRWTGGEVFTRKNFIQFLRLANELGFEQMILTNGLFFGKTKNEILVKEILSYVYLIQLSADDYGDGYDEFVKSKGAWKTLVKSVKFLNKNNIENIDNGVEKVDISLAITARMNNINSIEKIAKEFQFYIDYFVVSKEFGLGRSQVSSFESDLAFNDSIEIVEKLILEGIEIIHLSEKQNDDNQIHSSINTESFYANIFKMMSFAYIHSNGDVFPHPLMLDKVCGSIVDSSLLNVWGSDEFLKYRIPNL